MYVIGQRVSGERLQVHLVRASFLMFTTCFIFRCSSTASCFSHVTLPFFYSISLPLIQTLGIRLTHPKICTTLAVFLLICKVPPTRSRSEEADICGRGHLLFKINFVAISMQVCFIQFVESYQGHLTTLLGFRLLGFCCFFVCFDLTLSY